MTRNPGLTASIKVALALMLWPGLVVATPAAAVAQPLPRSGGQGGNMSIPQPTTRGSFSPAQRAEIVSILRDALRTDPSILRDALTALQADEGSRQEAASRSAIAAAGPALRGEAGDAIAGNPQGDVTLVEFYDVRCPYCRRMLPVLDQILQQDRGVRLVLKDLPVLGPASVLGARALQAAERQGGYMKMQTALMNGPPDITDATLREASQQAGLDWGRLQRDMADPAIQAKLTANLTMARTLGIDGTPSFVIGDQLVPGAIDQSTMKQLVAAARRR